MTTESSEPAEAKIETTETGSNMVTTPMDEAAATESPTQAMEDVVTSDEVNKPSEPTKNDGEAPALEKVKELKALVLKQVEYYFSDANLPTDLWLLRELHSNKGWLKIESLCRFNNMKRLSTDIPFIAAALKASKELLEVSSDDTKVRRRGYPASLNEERKDGLPTVQRTIYVKGYPKDLKDIEQTVKSSFETFGAIAHVKPRTKKAGGDLVFKGSVYIEYTDVESARRARFNSEGLKYLEEALIIYTKEEYMNLKYQEYVETHQKAWEVNRNQLPPPPPKVTLPPRPTKALLQFSLNDIEEPQIDSDSGGSYINCIKEFFSKPAFVRWVAKPSKNVGYVLYPESGDAEKALEHYGAHMEKPNGLFKGETILRLPTEDEEERFWLSYEPVLRDHITSRMERGSGSNRNSNGKRDMHRDRNGGSNYRNGGSHPRGRGSTPRGRGGRNNRHDRNNRREGGNDRNKRVKVDDKP
ncbi:hypothetical protein SeMB42_g05373 [Synchytrium endobioticum]|uniref:HTH La-type RNA-binding domain-containing protein n=1 Tax=Synchytrium endobioticum TaxID=286115 RepID=A0A507CRU1_9FUNG|nr:hypothetical protein SeMB42_g05377 [Synchytrium endobioticum]TPX41875.1 hypothetical protein SeMB42_g05373 [Synchytrium endobioticum]TPX46939.1 hypothetical protein SeLEV6574_g02951 [Synchytrium endobioticum]